MVLRAPLSCRQENCAKMRVLYYCSTLEEAPSLNDCLEPGNALYNKIYDVWVGIIRWRSLVTFLQLRILEGQRDALRFQWLP